MSSILGLTASNTFADKGFYNRNNRRRIFHDYPVGQFPLTGLLSLMDTEETDQTEFGWWEKRLELPETTIASATANGPFKTSAGNTLDLSLADMEAGTEYRVICADPRQIFQVRQQIWIPNLPAASGTVDVKGVITAIAHNYIQFQCLEDVRPLNTNNNLTSQTAGPGLAPIYCAGNANAEGSSATNGRFILPIRPTNYTQIFRNAFSFTRSALKAPVDFDKTGLYREKAEDNLRQHMVDMEMAFLFGVKDVQSITENGETTPRRTTGGIIWFLEQWEAANSIYRGGTGAAAVTALTDRDKRILPCTSNTVTWPVFNSWLERLFLVTNDRSFEKICMCGSGFLAAVNTFFEQSGAVTINRDVQTQRVYGMNLTTWETPFGTVHFKTHPLFSRNPALRYNGLFIDVQNLRYRALNDSDTTLLKNRHNRDYDGRKDEWMTEAGLEVNLPESCMYVKNMQSITKT